MQILQTHYVLDRPQIKNDYILSCVTMRNILCLYICSLYPNISQLFKLGNPLLAR